MNIEYTVQTWEEGGQFVSHAMPLDVASAGSNVEEARAAVGEAVQLFIETAKEHGTLDEVLEECGYSLEHSNWRSPLWIGIERHSAVMAD